MLTSVFLRLWLAVFGCFFSLGVLVVALPIYTKDVLGAGEVAIGAAMGVASVTALLAGPPAGRIADRRGRRVVLGVGGGIMAAGYAALLVGPPLIDGVAIGVFAGLGEPALVPAASPAAAGPQPAQRRRQGYGRASVGSYAGLAV